MNNTLLIPPPTPPPLLTDSQILTLASTGWLPLPLPPHLSTSLAVLSAASANFFAEPPSTKAALYRKDQGTEKGFYPIENEKEYLTLRCTVQPDSVLETLTAEVWSATAALLHRVLCDLARGLDLPDFVWDRLLDGCLTLPPDPEHTTPTLLRLFQYYPSAGFATPHTDMGLLTLCVGSGPGLECLDPYSSPQPTWHPTPTPTILIGEALRILSGNRVRAGKHRVVPNPSGRSSIVFALRPSLRHRIDLAPFGLGEVEMESKELWSKIQATRYNVNATPDVRHQQQERLKARLFTQGQMSQGDHIRLQQEDALRAQELAYKQQAQQVVK